MIHEPINPHYPRRIRTRNPQSEGHPSPSIDSNVGSLYPGVARKFAASNTPSTTSLHRFTPQSETNEMDPTGALQFLPAYSKSSATKASWEALLNEDEEETKTEPPRIRTVLPRSPQDTPSGSGSRMARLSLLFRQRNAAPASPSSSSSGYVGWPGTQDARGRVKSYDDSSSTAAGSDGRIPEWPLQRPNTTTPNSSTSSTVMRTTQSDIGTNNPSLRMAPSQLGPRRKRPTPQPNATAEPSLTYPSFQSQSTKPSCTASLFRKNSNTMAPTKEKLEANERFSAPPRTFRGYRGLMDKTAEVPCLMDDEDDNASKATSSTSMWRKSDVESDVFDGVTGARQYPASIAEEDEPGADFSMVSLLGGLTAIQSTALQFQNRTTASDYDDQLTNSTVDVHGYAHVPSYHDMVARGRTQDHALHGIGGNFARAEMSQISVSDYASSLFTDPYETDYCDYNDLSEYKVDPRAMKKLVRQYRRFSEGVDQTMRLSELDRQEDESKAFALLEMRSRIMEKDMERGLERRGGTVVVDDMVTTPYYRAGLRVRDACIVSKAWRDGVSPKDVINSAHLTRREETTYYIRRPVTPTTKQRSISSHRYTWEAVKWVDDTDFSLYRCPSLGPRNMRGFEMFTVGDCQSILLKLTNEQCETLRNELNNATRRQIEAEDFLHHEEADHFGNETMTMAEMDYLVAMEEVKTISRKLVEAEQAFTLVRERIQELVNRYQAMLVKIEAESCTGVSSVITFDSSYHSENDSQYWEEQDMLEQERWARRAQRAEVRAELAAREAFMAKRDAKIFQEQKQKELEDLRQKLMELQSDPSSAHFAGEREHSAAIAKNYAQHRNDPVLPSRAAGEGINREKLDGVKQRFRDRIAAKKKQDASRTSAASPSNPGTRNYTTASQVTPSPPSEKGLMQAAGEEMFSHLDFYERSLKAVETFRHY